MKKILAEILSLPTTTFHEEFVASYVTCFCERLGLKVQRDKVGNLIVRYKKGHARQPVAFGAHMDHPGFEVISCNGRLCEGALMGNVRLDYFVRSKVVIQTGYGLVKGHVLKKLGKEWNGKPVFEVEIKNKIRDKVRVGDFGWYDLTAVSIRGGMVYTKAADNLASVAALLTLLKMLVKDKINADVRCVFTRAEEVGFIGCISFANRGVLPKDVPIIILECSSATAGRVQIGGGPILRVGDKMSGFDPQIDCWLQEVALSQAKNIRYQRALLPGGRCEASVWVLKKLLVGGLAFPLGNYHNSGPKGPAPEYIHLNDYKWMMRLLVAICRAPNYKASFKKAAWSVMKNYKRWQKKLEVSS